MTLIYRTAGAWGAGKGSPLTKTEGDSNLYQLHTRIATLEGSMPTAGVGISSINQVSANQLSVTLSNLSTQGPFTLPEIIYTYRGVWTAFTPYNKYDRLTNNGSLYEVSYPHTSGSSFNPNASDGLGHDYYQLILANPGATLPSGGAAGYLLGKNSTTNYDFTWVNPATLTLPFTSITGAVAAAQLPNPSATTLGGVKSLAAVSHKFLTSITTAGLPVAAQPDFSDLSGALAASQIPPLPVNTSLTSATVLDITHANTYIPVNSSTDLNITIPPSSSVSWAADTEITLRNSGNGLLTVVGGAGVTLNIPTGFLAKALCKGSTIVAKYVAGNTWDIMGLLAGV